MHWLVLVGSAALGAGLVIAAVYFIRRAIHRRQEREEEALVQKAQESLRDAAALVRLTRSIRSVDDVKTVQKELKDKGVFEGELDGQFTPQLIEAVKWDCCVDKSIEDVVKETTPVSRYLEGTPTEVAEEIARDKASKQLIETRSVMHPAGKFFC